MNKYVGSSWLHKRECLNIITDQIWKHLNLKTSALRTALIIYTCTLYMYKKINNKHLSVATDLVYAIITIFPSQGTMN